MLSMCILAYKSQTPKNKNVVQHTISLKITSLDLHSNTRLTSPTETADTIYPKDR